MTGADHCLWAFFSPMELEPTYLVCFFFKIYFYFTYMGILSAWYQALHACLVSEEAEYGIRLPETGVVNHFVYGF